MTWVFLLQTGEVSSEDVFFCLDGGLEFGVGEAGEDVMGESASERVAAERGAVIARHDALGDVFVDDGGANGEPVA